MSVGVDVSVLLCVVQDYLCCLDATSTGIDHNSSVSLAADLVSSYTELNAHTKHLPVSRLTS